MNILIPVILGSEVRQFVWSDIASTLIDQSNDVYLSIRKIDPALEKEIVSFEPRLHLCDFFKVNINNSLLAYLTYILDHDYAKSNNPWKYKEVKKIAWYKLAFLDFMHLIISRIGFIKKMLINLEQQLSRSYDTTDWDKLIEDYKIDEIVLNVPRIAPKLCISAYKHKIPVLILFHTNKDIAAMLRPNFNYNAYGVWNQQMKDDLLNKFSDANNDDVKIIGNSHYNYLTKELPLSRQEEYKNKYSITNESFIILYTAAAPFVIKNEHVYVKDIIEQLGMRGIRNYIIILRKNPMDETDFLENVFNQNEKVIIQTPKWYWNKQFNFNYAHYEDLEEFSFLLKSANVCINIPSSVTVEASIKHLPVINLCYLGEGVELLTSGNIKDFWEAPFYKVYHKYDFIFPSFHKEETGIFIEKIYKRLNDPKEYENCVSETLAFNVENIKALAVKFISSSRYHNS